MTELENAVEFLANLKPRDESVSSMAGSVSPDLIDSLIFQQLLYARSLSEVDLEALEEANRRVCSEISRRKKPNATVSRR